MPTGHLERKKFVDWLGTVDDTAERYFLELKSDVDLNDKKHRAKVAKFVLGALNRMPDKALRRFEGHALMVLGVAKGAVTGIPGFEAMDLARDVQKFAGADADGRWDFETVPVDATNAVVIIQVDPPRWGDKPFVCQQDGDGLVGGDTYVRADGNTRKATAGELQQLFERMQRQAVTAEPAVEVVGVAHRISIDPDLRSEYLQHLSAERDRLLSTLPASPHGGAICPNSTTPQWNAPSSMSAGRS